MVAPRDQIPMVNNKRRKDAMKKHGDRGSRLHIESAKTNIVFFIGSETKMRNFERKDQSSSLSVVCSLMW